MFVSFAKEQKDSPNRTMTKAEEIKLLEELVVALTKDGDPTYCGDYFVNQLPFIKEAIRLDVSPDVYGKTVEEYHSEMVQEAKDIYATAEAEALDLIAKAKKEAARIEAQKNSAYEDADVALGDAITKLESVRERL